MLCWKCLNLIIFQLYISFRSFEARVCHTFHIWNLFKLWWMKLVGYKSKEWNYGSSGYMKSWAFFHKDIWSLYHIHGFQAYVECEKRWTWVLSNWSTFFSHCSWKCKLNLFDGILLKCWFYLLPYSPLLLSTFPCTSWCKF